MKDIFKAFVGSLVAMFVAGFVLIVVMIAAIVGLASSVMDETTEKYIPKDNSVLYMKLNREIVDRADVDPWEKINFGPFSSKKQLGLTDVLKYLNKAKTDDNIKGIYLDLGQLKMGVATVQEIRNALIDFKESGKWIISYSEFYSQKSYYLATVADEIYLYPEGEVDFKGLKAEVMFFKGALEKLEIEPQIIRGRNNKFKSAMEPFMYDHMSDANKEQVSKYLGSIWNEIVASISETRGISKEELQRTANELLLETAQDAVNLKFVDGLMYKDQILAELRSRLALDEDDDIVSTPFSKYVNSGIDRPLGIDNHIAVVYAAGSIEGGKGDEETIGSERISKAIRKARLDTTVKAIVLRVNSPGGSALASDVMWREMVLAKEAKPVVVSMGNVAASGGYYIACAADKIFASPTTITGSIGVFGVIPNMEKFYKNKLGITFDGVKTNDHADILTVSRSMTEFEHDQIQRSVERIYTDFKEKVAAGRGMTVDEVDAIGQGRVWTGIDALEIGLVDEMGGLEAAISAAASLAALDQYNIKSLPEQEDPFEEMFKELSGEVEAFVLEQKFGANYGYFKHLEELSTMSGVQAKLPYIITIN